MPQFKEPNRYQQHVRRQSNEMISSITMNQEITHKHIYDPNSGTVSFIVDAKVDVSH